ncbi:hypothetical protein FRC19_001392 [Serendipita sp. 401]|nr:hypothetical protein FRC19_001392 [Serendipita sp. 401]
MAAAAAGNDRTSGSLLFSWRPSVGSDINGSLLSQQRWVEEAASVINTAVLWPNTTGSLPTEGKGMGREVSKKGEKRTLIITDEETHLGRGYILRGWLRKLDCHSPSLNGIEYVPQAGSKEEDATM